MSESAEGRNGEERERNGQANMANGREEGFGSSQKKRSSIKWSTPDIRRDGEKKKRSLGSIHKCFSTVTYIKYLLNRTILLNQPKSKIGHSCANSWHKKPIVNCTRGSAPSTCIEILT